MLQCRPVIHDPCMRCDLRACVNQVGKWVRSWQCIHAHLPSSALLSDGDPCGSSPILSRPVYQSHSTRGLTISYLAFSKSDRPTKRVTYQVASLIFALLFVKHILLCSLFLTKVKLFLLSFMH
jgi:hypothetical protein